MHETGIVILAVTVALLAAMALACLPGMAVADDAPAETLAYPQDASMDSSSWYANVIFAKRAGDGTATDETVSPSELMVPVTAGSGDDVEYGYYLPSAAGTSNLLQTRLNALYVNHYLDVIPAGQSDGDGLTFVKIVSKPSYLTYKYGRVAANFVDGTLVNNLSGLLVSLDPISWITQSDGAGNVANGTLGEAESMSGSSIMTQGDGYVDSLASDTQSAVDALGNQDVAGKTDSDVESTADSVLGDTVGSSAGASGGSDFDGSAAGTAINERIKAFVNGLGVPQLVYAISGFVAAYIFFVIGIVIVLALRKGKGAGRQMSGVGVLFLRAITILMAIPLAVGTYHLATTAVGKISTTFSSNVGEMARGVVVNSLELASDTNLTPILTTVGSSGGTSLASRMALDNNSDTGYDDVAAMNETLKTINRDSDENYSDRRAAEWLDTYMQVGGDANRATQADYARVISGGPSGGTRPASAYVNGKPWDARLSSLNVAGDGDILGGGAVSIDQGHDVVFVTGGSGGCVFSKTYGGTLIGMGTASGTGDDVSAALKGRNKDDARWADANMTALQTLVPEIAAESSNNVDGFYGDASSFMSEGEADAFVQAFIQSLRSCDDEDDVRSWAQTYFGALWSPTTGALSLSFKTYGDDGSLSGDSVNPVSLASPSDDSRLASSPTEKYVNILKAIEQVATAGESSSAASSPSAGSTSSSSSTAYASDAQTMASTNWKDIPSDKDAVISDIQKIFYTNGDVDSPKKGIYRMALQLFAFEVGSSASNAGGSPSGTQVHWLKSSDGTTVALVTTSDSATSAIDVTSGMPAAYVYVYGTGTNGAKSQYALSTYDYVANRASVAGYQAVNPWNAQQLSAGAATSASTSPAESAMYVNSAARAIINKYAGVTPASLLVPGASDASLSGIWSLSTQSVMFLLQSAPTFGDDGDAVSSLSYVGNHVPRADGAGDRDGNWFLHYDAPHQSLTELAAKLGYMGLVGGTQGIILLYGLVIFATMPILTAIGHVLRGFGRMAFTGDIFGFFELFLFAMALPASYWLFKNCVVGGTFLVKVIIVFIAALLGESDASVASLSGIPDMTLLTSKITGGTGADYATSIATALLFLGLTVAVVWFFCGFKIPVGSMAGSRGRGSHRHLGAAVSDLGGRDGMTVTTLACMLPFVLASAAVRKIDDMWANNLYRGQNRFAQMLGIGELRPNEQADGNLASRTIDSGAGAVGRFVGSAATRGMSADTAVKAVGAVTAVTGAIGAGAGLGDKIAGAVGPKTAQAEEAGGSDYAASGTEASPFGPAEASDGQAAAIGGAQEPVSDLAGQEQADEATAAFEGGSSDGTVGGIGSADVVAADDRVAFTADGGPDAAASGQSASGVASRDVNEAAITAVYGSVPSGWDSPGAYGGQASLTGIEADSGISSGTGDAREARPQSQVAVVATGIPDGDDTTASGDDAPSGSMDSPRSASTYLTGDVYDLSGFPDGTDASDLRGMTPQQLAALNAHAAATPEPGNPALTSGTTEEESGAIGAFTAPIARNADGTFSVLGSQVSMAGDGTAALSDGTPLRRDEDGSYRLSDGSSFDVINGVPALTMPDGWRLTVDESGNRAVIGPDGRLVPFTDGGLPPVIGPDGSVTRADEPTVSPETPEPGADPMLAVAGDETSDAYRMVAGTNDADVGSAARTGDGVAAPAVTVVVPDAAAQDSASASDTHAADSDGRDIPVRADLSEESIAGKIGSVGAGTTDDGQLQASAIAEGKPSSEQASPEIVTVVNGQSMSADATGAAVDDGVNAIGFSEQDMSVRADLSEDSIAGDIGSAGTGAEGGGRPSIQPSSGDVRASRQAVPEVTADIGQPAAVIAGNMSAPSSGSSVTDLSDEDTPVRTVMPEEFTDNRVGYAGNQEDGNDELPVPSSFDDGLVSGQAAPEVTVLNNQPATVPTASVDEASAVSIDGSSDSEWHDMPLAPRSAEGSVAGEIGSVGFHGVETMANSATDAFARVPGAGVGSARGDKFVTESEPASARSFEQQDAPDSMRGSAVAIPDLAQPEDSAQDAVQSVVGGLGLGSSAGETGRYADVYDSDAIMTDMARRVLVDGEQLSQEDVTQAIRHIVAGDVMEKVGIDVSSFSNQSVSAGSGTGTSGRSADAASAAPVVIVNLPPEAWRQETVREVPAQPELAPSGAQWTGETAAPNGVSGQAAPGRSPVRGDDLYQQPELDDDAAATRRMSWQSSASGWVDSAIDEIGGGLSSGNEPELSSMTAGESAIPSTSDGGDGSKSADDADDSDVAVHDGTFGEKASGGSTLA